ncbi:ATP-binding protein [Pedobacter sp. V48]|uniref:tetratricopeptide repeat-containing sensor histidine kinase n=1 Tax=Pedobacter sp. V48 TaxID=509635 RepID=UPI0003E47553|nr:ATP-binding protein [Pedobacter sp. V48]ETZ20928.1 hypothetical protein N824_02125 [Pedobacter sp. V48]
MKKEFISIIALFCLFGCQKPDIPAPLSESTDFKKAEAFLHQHKIDSAFSYFDRVATGSKDSLEAAMAYNYMASIQSDAGDYYGAQESLTTSLTYLDEQKKEHRYCLASDYNELGMTSSKLENFDSAVDYFDLAIKFSDEEAYRLIFLNNKANAFRSKGDYKQALRFYQQVLGQTKREGKEYARLLNNMASTKWLQNPSYNAGPELFKALQIRQIAKDLRGQNSSYTHLADYYSKSKPDSGLYFANKMYLIARQLNLPDAKLDALKKLIRLSPAEKAKGYFIQYEQLNDSLQTARNAAKNQFALIRYHTEKSKADNLKLQKENSEKRYELIQERIRFYGMLGLFLLILFLAVRWYKIRKKRTEQEKQEAILENQRKASKKVHDTLANDLYRIMKTVQYGSEQDPDWLMDNLDDVYQRARDLSYDIVDDNENFELKLSVLIKSFATDTTRVILVGNSHELWLKVPAAVKTEIKYIIQELMVNMRKHSQATDVVIRFEKQSNRCLISYIDDGVGMQKSTVFNNGLVNTGNRIKAIDGELTFVTNTGKGLEINITFPLA